MKRYDLRPESRNSKILDIGCGFNPTKESNILLDIDKSIKGYFDKEFVYHDANKLPYPFKNSTFDYIYLNNILEHLIVEDELLFKELLRILKTQGKIEIHCPNSLFIYHRLLYLFGIIPCDFIINHRKHYSFQQMKHNLRNAGFKIFELNNKWLFNPFKNFTNPHIRIIAVKTE